MVVGLIGGRMTAKPDIVSDNVPDIVIVGAGIVGACLAYEASQRGLKPLVLSVGSPAGGGSATAASWAWINACSTENPDYFRLRHASLRRWQVWQQQIDGIAFSARETFLWDLPPDELANAVAQLSAFGYPVELLSGDETAARLPRLRERPGAALYTAIEGAVEPVATAARLIEASGAGVMQAHVHGLIVEGMRVTGVMTDKGPVAAGETVLAAGNATPALLQTIGVTLKMQSSDGLLVLSRPVERFLDAVVAGPDFHVRQRLDGCLLVGGTFGAYAPRPGMTSLYQNAAAQLARIASVFDCPAALEMDSFTLGRRPIPAGGMPCVGRSLHPDGGIFDGLYTVVMHSGFSNGAGVAQAALEDILSGTRTSEIAPFGMVAS